MGDYSRKRLDFQGSPADQGTVDVGLGKKIHAVFRFHRAAVKQMGIREASALFRIVSHPRMKEWASCACAGVAFRPVPIAHTGS